MDPVITDPQAREARMLAAIVFTDVVGFSKLASQNEGRVYVALQRDMGVMTNLCHAHRGQVLNTMGDGMLLCFASAVDAMSCATEIQQTLYNQSHSIPATEVLHHRIGVHLGDVIMNGDNVFGDGVNVAARLQALAKPDAVCFSGTVHEIIKNKLRLDAKYLGPRQLKNLGEPVPVWQIAPLGERQATLASDDLAVSSGSEATSGVSGAKAGLMVLASLILIGGLVFAFTRLKKPPPIQGHRKPGAAKPAKESSLPPVAFTDSGPTANAASVAAAIDGYKKSYDFEAISAELERNGALVPDLAAKRSDFARLAQMKSFVEGQLSRTNATTAVTVNLPQAGAADVYLSGGQLCIRPQGQVVTQMAWPPAPEVYAAIVESLMKQTVDGSTAPADGESWLQLFCSEYGVSVPTSGT